MQSKIHSAFRMPRDIATMLEAHIGAAMRRCVRLEGHDATKHRQGMPALPGAAKRNRDTVQAVLLAAPGSGIKRVCEATGLSAATVSNAFAFLRADRVLKSDKRGAGGTCRYWIATQTPEKSPRTGQPEQRAVTLAGPQGARHGANSGGVR